MVLLKPLVPRDIERAQLHTSNGGILLSLRFDDGLLKWCQQEERFG